MNVITFSAGGLAFAGGSRFCRVQEILISKLTARKMLIATLVLCLAPSAGASVVNIDVEVGAAGDTNHVGADGPLSTSGVVWNSVIGGVGMNDLMDEFSRPSPFDIVYLTPGSGGTWVDPGINNLQDSGTAGPFQIQDLLPGQAYEIAVYVGPWGGFIIQDASGPRRFFFANPRADGWGLPGTEGKGGDYFLVRDVIPFDLGDGVFGVGFVTDGDITGLQIDGAVPEPTSLLFLGLGGLTLLGRKRP